MTKYKGSFCCTPKNLTLSAWAVALLALAGCASTATTPAATSETAATPVVSTAPAEEDLPPALFTPVTSLSDARANAPVSLKENAPLRYVVKKGDTLWDIANRYLDDAWEWPELWYVNGKIANPHRIYPGDVLELVNIGGRTRLAYTGPIERLAPRVRESALDDALPAIPIDAIRNFLRGPRVVDADTLAKAPYVLSFTDEHLLGGAGMGVFVKNLKQDAGTLFSLVRKGVAYRDPDNGDLLGYEALPTGETEISHYGEPADGVISKSFREVLRGDALLPPEAENFNANFFPHAPAKDVNGQIIAVFDGLSQISQYQIITLNRGSNHGLEPGHVLTIRQALAKATDPRTGEKVNLPLQNAGTAMVFKVSPRLSYALVMKATRPAHVLDRVSKPTSSTAR